MWLEDSLCMVCCSDGIYLCPIDACVIFLKVWQMNDGAILCVFTGVAKAKICKVSSLLLKAAALNLVLT